MRGNFEYTNNETVMQIVQQAARAVHRKYSRYIDKDELVSEAHIALSTKGDLQASIKAEQWGYLQHGLENDLEHVCLKLARRNGRNVSFEALEEGVGDVNSVGPRTFADVNEHGLRGVRDEDVPPEQAAPVTIRKVSA